MRQMLVQQEDVFHYITLMNESYAQPSMPEGVQEDLLQGLYCVSGPTPDEAHSVRVRLVGSGTILREVMAAAELLQSDWGVTTQVWSATSFSELERQARRADRHNRIHPQAKAQVPHVQRCLAGPAPVVVASDYVRAWPQLIAPYIRAPLTVLGTDGFGRSDTRTELRRFFEVDRQHIVLAALQALRECGQVTAADCAAALNRYGIEADEGPPWSR